MAQKKKKSLENLKKINVSSLKNKIKKPKKETLQSEDKEKSKKDKVVGFFHTRAGLVTGTIILIVIMTLGIFSVGIYKFGWSDNVTVEVSRIIPFPAFFVNSTPVTYAKYQDYSKAYTTYITEFYIKGEKKIDVNSDEAKEILEKSEQNIKDLLVRNTIIKSEVKKRNIKYTQDDLNKAFDEFVKRTGGEEEVKNNLKKYYGLTVERFKSEFFVDTFLSGKLQNAIQEDASLNEAVEAKANEVLAKVKAGEDFAELAKQYSEDSTASKGGSLDFVKKGQLVPEFEDALWALTEPGQTSDLVKTVYGYHIIKLVEIRGEERKASHILIKTKDYETWLQEEVEKANIKYWIQ